MGHNLTVIYPLIKSKWGEEIKYSLRSLDTYLTTDFNVILYSDYVPPWINESLVEIVPTPIQSPPAGYNTSQYNIGLIFQDIIQRTDFNDFVYFNDDVYLLDDTSGFDNIYNLKMENPLPVNQDDTPFWVTLLYNTLSDLKDSGNTFYNYETHIPYTYNIKKLATLSNVLSGQHLLASSYFNRFPPVYSAYDNKVHLACYRQGEIPSVILSRCRKYKFLTHSDQGLRAMKYVLPRLFPNKSKFEI